MDSLTKRTLGYTADAKQQAAKVYKSTARDGQTVEVLRDERGRIMPGSTLNPKGRTPIAEGGSPNDPYKLRQRIAEQANQVIDRMLQSAIEGDIVAGDKLLQYILPKLQAVAVEANDAATLPIMKVITAVQEANRESKEILEGEVVDPPAGKE
jgi:hypothetical protein